MDSESEEDTGLVEDLLGKCKINSKSDFEPDEEDIGSNDDEEQFYFITYRCEK